MNGSISGASVNHIGTLIGNAGLSTSVTLQNNYFCLFGNYNGDPSGNTSNDVSNNLQNVILNGVPLQTSINGFGFYYAYDSTIQLNYTKIRLNGTWTIYPSTYCLFSNPSIFTKILITNINNSYVFNVPNGYSFTFFSESSV